VTDYQIEMLWRCSVCAHKGNRGLKDRYCCNCGHKKDESDPEYMPADMSRAAALSGDDERRAKAGADWICKYCESSQNQLNKCCGNCGTTERGDRLQGGLGADVAAYERGRAESHAAASTPPPWSTEPEHRAPQLSWYRFWLHRAVLRIVIVTAVVFLGWLVWWLFAPRVVEAKVSQLYWQHDTQIERYQVYRREGWSPSLGSFDVMPLGLRHHHFDRVHVGSHREPYQESYTCGETCTTSASSTSCSSNANGTATCRTTPGTRSCTPRYCSRTAYRTVQDYENVSRRQMWFGWREWDWGHHRTITRSGFGHATTWPAESEIKAWLNDGERERSSRHASYKVTFADVADGDAYVLRPSEAGFRALELGDRRKLKVTNAGSVEVLP
jgi:hypothetical protein